MDVLYLIDRESFPVNCAELNDLRTLLSAEDNWFELRTDNPSVFFQQAIKFAESNDLVVPITRNGFVRDKLKVEGVTLIITI